MILLPSAAAAIIKFLVAFGLTSTTSLPLHDAVKGVLNRLLLAASVNRENMIAIRKWRENSKIGDDESVLLATCKER